MKPEQREELADCPFCGGTMEPFGPSQHNHPRNACWLSSIKVETPEYESWNRRAQVEALTVPQGWQLVPVESTSAMDIAGRDSLSCDGAMQIDAELCYAAMLAAAPTIPAIPGTKEGA